MHLKQRVNFSQLCAWSGAFILIGSLLWGCNTSNQGINTPLVSRTDSHEVKLSLLLDSSTSILADKKINNEIKNGIAENLILPLSRSDHIVITGTDKQTRPVAVNFQKAIEQNLVDLLDRGMVSNITAIIHTPMPATPLCNPAGQSLASSMHPDMRQDSNRVKTLEDRTITTRRMACYGKSIKLYIAYPREGLSKRNKMEQSVYRQELADRKNSSLVDAPLTGDKLPADLIGATYLITTPTNQQLVFSLTGQQAATGTGQTDWSIWLGSLKNFEVSKQYIKVVHYLKEHGSNITI